jgi:hypothetical protein
MTMADEREKNVSGAQGSFWRRHRGLKWTGIVTLAVLAVLAVVISVALHHAEPYLRARIVSALQDHFHARVELDSFHMSLTSGLRAEGKGLRIWPPAEVHGVSVPAPRSGEPLISLDEFRFRAPLHYSPGEPIHISLVQLKGITVDVPPKSRFTHNEEQKGGDHSKVEQALIHFKVGAITCTDVHLILETSKPNRPPLEFAIASLKLTDLQEGGTMKFNANLTNARPVGNILTKGTFGPWTVEDPGESPISGDYDFEHANLGDFKGIAGTLNSTGKYEGTLRNMTVDGVTDTPDFRLTNFGTPMNLHTQFHATVDGTNGDTWLQPVYATLGQSHFTVQGEVVREAEAEREGKPNPAGNPPGADGKIPGHNISLTVDVPKGRMEDFMRLTSKSKMPMLTGVLTLKSSLDIPPGKEPVHERMKLKGSFSLDDAYFTSAKIQDRIGDLSLRGQGLPKEAKDKEEANGVRSEMQGNFQMARAVISLPDLEYTVPGVEVNLKGTYKVEGGGLNFAGTAKMQATVSQMLGGWKGFLAKPVDRFFKKNGAGTQVGVHIEGTRDDPHFGIDFGRPKHTSPESPNEQQ